METFKTICHDINQLIPANSIRQWDEEFHVVRIMFNKNESNDILPRLETAFKNQWDFSTIDNASDDLNSFISSFFGLIPGQIVFATDHSPPLLFSVWWPWGDNQHISIRFGMLCKDDDQSGEDNIKKKLIEWFGISNFK